jgi:hypothetical protein
LKKVQGKRLVAYFFRTVQRLDIAMLDARRQSQLRSMAGAKVVGASCRRNQETLEDLINHTIAEYQQITLVATGGPSFAVQLSTQQGLNPLS